MPILYSFRRCPYAMRARLAIYVSGLRVELREIMLRDKAPEFLLSSPKATVPVLITNKEVIEESFDIMVWCLKQSDPEHWLAMPDEGYEWILRSDGPFKEALDHTKYSVRFPDLDPKLEQAKALKFLTDLNLQIGNSNWVFGEGCSLADMALLPFIRQFSKNTICGALETHQLYFQELVNHFRSRVSPNAILGESSTIFSRGKSERPLRDAIIWAAFLPISNLQLSIVASCSGRPSISSTLLKPASPICLGISMS
jgi:glutathione S-transferase